MNARSKVRTSTHIYLYIIWLGIFFILISGSFLGRSVSLEAIQTTNVARSMNTEHFVDYWQPQSENTIYAPDAHSYLPLGYFLHRWTMQLVGDNFYMEKVISLLMFFLCGFMLIHVWKSCRNSWATGWIPLGLWLMVPIVSHSATRNILDITLSFIVLCALSCLVRGYFQRRKYDELSIAYPKAAKSYQVQSFANSFFAGLLMSLAFLVKGFAGVFLLSFPIVVWLFTKKEKIWKPLLDTLLIVLAWVVVSIILFILVPNTHEIITYYIDGQFHTPEQQATVRSHLWIFYETFRQLLIPVIFCFVIWLAFIKKNNIKRYLLYWKHRDELTESELRNSVLSWGFVTLGLIGIIPRSFTLMQHDYDMIAMIPMFILGCACTLRNVCVDHIENMPSKAVVTIQILAFAISIAAFVTNFDSISRGGKDKEFISDMDAILPLLDPNSTISVTPEMMQDELAAAYMLRYKGITFDTALNKDFFLTTYPDIRRLRTDVDYQQFQLSTTHYFLYSAVINTEDSVAPKIEVEETTSDADKLSEAEAMDDMTNEN